MILTLLGAFIFSAITARITSFLIGEQPHGVDLADQLERLKQLHASGALSADEFQTAKARVFAS